MRRELQKFLNENLVEAGCDEAGRGPLAGPVYAAAVILPKDFHHPLLNDSKKMTSSAREKLRPIIEAEAIAWAVEEVSAQEIDQMNILNASLEGMRRAVARLSVRPEFLALRQFLLCCQTELAVRSVRVFLLIRRKCAYFSFSKLRLL